MLFEMANQSAVLDRRNFELETFLKIPESKWPKNVKFFFAIHRVLFHHKKTRKENY
jgi:hypothetical protein